MSGHVGLCSKRSRLQPLQHHMASNILWQSALGIKNRAAYGCCIPCAASAPPVMLWQMSRSPGLEFSIFPGVVCPFDQYLLIPSRIDTSYFGILVTLEKMRSPNEPSIIIPHDDPFLLIARNLEGILENYMEVSTALTVNLMDNAKNIYLQRTLVQSALGTTFYRCYTEYVSGSPQYFPTDES